MAKLATRTKFRGLDNSGDPLNGGLLYTYEAGGVTPKDTYTDSTEDTPNANPVVLDANGFANVWLGAGAYKLVLKDSGGTTIEESDNVIGDSASGFLADITEHAVSYSVVASDKNAFLIATASLTFTLLASATAGEGFAVTFRNDHTAAITLDGNAAETIDGAATFSLLPDQVITLVCDGSNWRSSSVSAGTGTSGYVLTANGVGTPSTYQAASSGLTLISTSTISGSPSELTITSGIDSTYEDYLVILEDIIIATDGQPLNLQISDDGGSTYESGATDYEYHVAISDSSATTYVGQASAGTTFIRLANSLGNTSADGMTMNLWLRNPASAATNFKCDFHGSAHRTTSPSFRNAFGVGCYNAATSAVDAIRIYAGSGNLTSGTVRLYGVAKS